MHGSELVGPVRFSVKADSPLLVENWPLTLKLYEHHYQGKNGEQEKHAHQGKREIKNALFCYKIRCEVLESQMERIRPFTLKALKRANVALSAALLHKKSSRYAPMVAMIEVSTWRSSCVILLTVHSGTCRMEQSQPG